MQVGPEETAEAKEALVHTVALGEVEEMGETVVQHTFRFTLLHVLPHVHLEITETLLS